MAKTSKRKIQDRIVLMDLNVALSSNFQEMRNYGFEDFVKNHEKYRQWMVELLRPEFVILITARNIKWALPTLQRIADVTEWQPDVALFNDTGYDGQDAPMIKHHQLINNIFPKYGDNPAIYHAIESNSSTRSMYRKHGIDVHDCCHGRDRWYKLPF